jgi:phosphoglycolate phosphatase
MRAAAGAGVMKSILPHLKNKKHVIWDWNGTLLADIQHVIEITNTMLREKNLPALTVERYKQVFGFPIAEYCRKIGFDLNHEDFLRHCEDFNRLFVEGLHTCSLWPGVEEMLREIKLSAKLQSLLSASEQGILNHQISVFGLEKYFDHVYGIADKAAVSKVSRGHELMKKAGVDPAHTILIGDTDHDLEVGNALGVEVILVEHGHQHADRLRKVHHKVLKLI